MTAISEETAAKVLANCGRRCCICRKFRPLRLQVHHIIERAEGGTDVYDNLIALCLMCHTDVHSKVPFTQRFTRVELKLHRENLYRLIAEGKLPADEEEPPLRDVVNETVRLDNRSPDLIPEAINLLISLATGEGWMLAPSAFNSFDTVFDRARATDEAAFDQLCRYEFLRFQSGEMYAITLNGYLAADAYLALINQKSD